MDNAMADIQADDMKHGLYDTCAPTEDDIRDVAIRITDALVKAGLIPDCTDTEEQTEFDVQDIIETEVLAFAERFWNLTVEEE